MTYPLNPSVRAVQPPPTEEAQAWVSGREFPPEKPLLDAAQAVPQYPPAKALREHLARLILETGAGEYTPLLGLPALREALAGEVMAEYAGPVTANQVAITAGCNQAFCLAMAALVQPGDEVIMPLPYYFNYEMWLTMQGARPIPMPFNEAGNGVPDPEQATALVTERTRAIVLVTPNNPTGAIYGAPVIEGFYQLAREKGIALVLDETYKDFHAETGPAHGLFQKGDWPETLVRLYSFSKAYSLAGYRVGAMICGAPLMEEIAKVADCLAICAPRIGQEAALFALKELVPWREEKRALIHGRQRALVEAFREIQPGYELVSVGGSFAYVRHPFGATPSKEVAKRLADEQNLLCLPGSTFGPGQEPYLRVAFANLEAAQMPELARRLAKDAAG